VKASPTLVSSVKSTENPGRRREKRARVAEESRRAAFLALVASQDAGGTARSSRELAARRFGLRGEQVRAIGREGIENNWPPLRPGRRGRNRTIPVDRARRPWYSLTRAGLDNRPGIPNAIASSPRPFWPPRPSQPPTPRQDRPAGVAIRRGPCAPPTVRPSARAHVPGAGVLRVARPRRPRE